MRSHLLNPPPFSLTEFVERAFSILDVELPEMHRRLATTLAGVVVGLEIDGEQMTVSFRGASGADPPVVLVRSGFDASLDARIATDAGTILRVVDGELTLIEAVDQGAVRARAELGVLQELLAGLGVFVHGGVRCPTFPALLESFRSFARWRGAEVG